jgi:glycerophosphoryl diester phosphodiesterase
MIKLFAHRGLWSVEAPQNSINSLKNAYNQGFRAIEFDIWFLQGLLLLKHDCPKDNDFSNLAQLKDYFLYKNELEYWLDFKNLDEKNAYEALILVKKIIDESNISLDKIFFAPFITNYKKAEKILLIIKAIFGDEAKFVAVLEDIKNFGAVISFLRKNNIKHLSINHELLSEANIKKLSHIEIFAWTIKNKNRLEELKKLGIKNFATDIKI